MQCDIGLQATALEKDLLDDLVETHKYSFFREDYYA